MRKCLFVFFAALLVVGCKSSRSTAHSGTVVENHRASETSHRISNAVATSSTSSHVVEEIFEYDTSLPVDSITKLPPVLRKTRRVIGSSSTENSTSTEAQIDTIISSSERVSTQESSTEQQHDSRLVAWPFILVFVAAALFFILILKFK